MNGLKASIVTIQGETVVPKLLPKNGPSGTYSHFWISRAKNGCQAEFEILVYHSSNS
jgi:hypothetical protein